MPLASGYAAVSETSWLGVDENVPILGPLLNDVSFTLILLPPFLSDFAAIGYQVWQ